MQIDYQKFFIACAKSKMNVGTAIEKAGLSNFVLSKIKHEQNLNALTVGKLAEALNVSVEELLILKRP